MQLRPLHDRLIVQRLDDDVTQRTGAVDGVEYLIMKEDDVLAIQERSL